MEILAPCGSPEHIRAAVNAGADAVYLGGRGFSARRNAANFDASELSEAVRYCHANGVRVYVAVNILVRDGELPQLRELLGELADAGPDALITQDLGAARLIREYLPEMPLHASTQMSVHTLEGVRFCAEQGFERVVIARECDKETLTAITRDAPCGIEVFVHGAMCVSVSGQCLLSSVIGGRSGNRGLCAQPCRLDFSGGGLNYALSLKDLSLVRQIPELAAMGVTSLKIEGRMKRPEYVAAAVRACRDALDGREPEMAELEAVFSRQGFTQGYYTGHHAGMQGTRTADDVRAAAEVLPKLSALCQTRSRRIPLDMRLELRSGQPVKLIASDGADTAEVMGAVPETALTRETTAQDAGRLLSRLGDTPFELRKLETLIEPELMLSASQINALRRDACKVLLDARTLRNTRHYIMQIPSERSLTAPPPATVKFRLHCCNWEQARTSLEKHPECETVLPLSEFSEISDNSMVSRVLWEPPLFIDDESAVGLVLTRLREHGGTRLICQNPAHARLGKKLGFDLHGGYALQVTNSVTAAVWGDYGLLGLTVSPELKLTDIRELRSPVPLGLIAFGRLPLMLLRRCPFGEVCKNGKRCPAELTDRTERRFSVDCRGAYRILLNSDMLWLAGRKLPDGMFLSLYLDGNTDIDALLRAYRDGGDTTPPQNHTRGLYFRGTQ